MTTAAPFLMFEGRAEEALAFYVDVVPDSELLRTEGHEGETPDAPGKIKLGEARIAGLQVKFSDSAVAHGFTFTPSISHFVECDTDAEVEVLAEALGQDGQVLMPIGSYPFSRRFTWLNDRFGVSWQLSSTEGTA